MVQMKGRIQHFREGGGEVLKKCPPKYFCIWIFGGLLKGGGGGGG